MVERKLRLAPSCYHVLHLIPVMAAHERNFLVDEGLVDEVGDYGYELVTGGLVPFGWEKQALGRGMKEQGIDIALDVLGATVFHHQQHPRGRELRIVAGWRNQSDMCWVGQPEIHSLRELRGKRLGVMDYGDILYRGLRPWLREAGLDPDRDVDWVRGIHPGHQAEALRAGDVDATFMRTFEGQDLSAEGFNVLIEIRRQYPRGRPDRVIAATPEVLERQPEAVVAFLRAMLRAYWYVRDQPRNFQHLYDMERRLRRASRDDEERYKRFANPTPRHHEHLPFPIDGLPTALDVVAQEEYDAGDIDAMPDIDAVCRLEFVRQAFADLRSRPELQDDYARARSVVERVGY